MSHPQSVAELLAAGHAREALAALAPLLAQQPMHATTWMHQALAHKDLLQLPEARASIERALALSPQDPAIRYNRSLLALMAGDDAQAWADYEARWQLRAFPSPLRHRDRQRWQGQPLPQGCLLVHSEQGAGDTLQFARLLPLVAQRVRLLLVEVEAELLTLLAPLVPQAMWIARGQAVPPSQAELPMLSMPLATGWRLRDLQAQSSYLQVPPERLAWARAVLPAAGRLRVGLVWRGRASHVDDRWRSLALATLLAQLPQGPQYVSLQVAPRADEQALLRAQGIVDPTLGVRDWADTAALCAQVDRVLCVDTGVAHLAAALGRPTGVLLAHVPDWRWQLQRPDSPWYPSMRLFRQTQQGVWTQALSDASQWLLAP
ncbi:MAG: hypothetical protein RIQ97_1903 [Pseudomonadota bacterium]|jgi:hypothetical protein